jgi:hypothetical protein
VLGVQVEVKKLDREVGGGLDMLRPSAGLWAD